MAGRANLGNISETEFSSLLQMLSSTAKGRGFLDEYRRRFQPEDTLGLLDSLQRIEGTMGAVRDQLQPERIAEELLHVAMSLDIAMEGADADPEGDETARRFALADRARHELRMLAANLAGGVPQLSVVHPEDAQAPDGLNGGADGDATPGTPRYRLRDPAPER
jgi:hypothetical protein